MKWKTIADLFNLGNGYTPSKSVAKFWESGQIPWFRMDDIRKNGRVLDDSMQKVSKGAVKGGKLFPANSIIIATTATIGEHALVTVPFLANQQFIILSLKEEYVRKIDIKFVFYYCFILAEWCKRNTKKSSFPSVNMEGFKRLKIPIPFYGDLENSLAEQRRIATTIEKFDRLTTSLSEGLPREIELRKKQYSHYRDLLLDFPKQDEQIS
ncbi:MAG: restriction endonuclease subunit S [Aestuariivita sp.]|nr:restriction endonuclease subunit S [Aestuariivita sp.]